MAFVFISFIIIVFILFADFQKGVLLYTPFKLFFNFNVRLGLITFDFAISAIVLLLFLFKWQNKRMDVFPLKKGFILYGLLYCVSCFYPDFVPNYIPRVILVVLLYGYVYYYCLSNINNVKFALLCYALFGLVMCLNGLLQPLFGINPLDDLLQSVSDTEQSIFIDNKIERLGQIRYRSFIPHPISYGVACVIIALMLFWGFMKLHLKSKERFIFLISLAFLMSGIIICGSRSPILGLLPLPILVFSGEIKLNNKQWIYISLLIIALVYFSGEYIWYSIQTIFDENLAKEARGSSLDLRYTQYSLAINWFKENPWLGKGMLFNAYSENEDIAGAESVWLPLIMKNGVVGVLSYILFYVYLFKTARKCSQKIYLYVFLISWLIMRTATSLIGVTDIHMLALYFCIYRYSRFSYNLNHAKIVNYHSRLQRRTLHR